MTEYSAFHFSGLNKRYGNRVILHDTELHLKTGHCLQLRGKNGSGKSTLLRVLAGLEKPEQGLVSIDSQSIKWHRARKILHKNIMYLHQQPFMFEGSVFYNLAYPVQRLPSDEKQYKVRQAIEWAGLEHLANAQAKHLSGGEKQRVALARAWLHQPRAMLLDEPTANLDTSSREKSLQLMQTLKEQGIALAIASHDSGHFQHLFDSTYELAGGQLRAVDEDINDRYIANNVTPLKKVPA